MQWISLNVTLKSDKFLRGQGFFLKNRSGQHDPVYLQIDIPSGVTPTLAHTNIRAHTPTHNITHTHTHTHKSSVFMWGLFQTMQEKTHKLSFLLALGDYACMYTCGPERMQHLRPLISKKSDTKSNWWVH